MKVITIKQYSEIYHVAFGYNGAQFGYGEDKIAQDITRTAINEAHDRFIVSTNKIRNIPTPKFDDCKFNVLKSEYTEEQAYRTYVVKVEVVWQYEK
jgi:hypothetical protein